MITFRTFHVNKTRGIGIGHTGTRELIQASLTTTENIMFGIDIDLEFKCPISINIRFWRLSLNLRILNEINE